MVESKYSCNTKALKNFEMDFLKFPANKFVISYELLTYLETVKYSQAKHDFSRDLILSLIAV